MAIKYDNMNSIRCYGKLQYIIIMKEIIRDEL